MMLTVGSTEKEDIEGRGKGQVASSGHVVGKRRVGDGLLGGRHVLVQSCYGEMYAVQLYSCCSRPHRLDSPSPLKHQKVGNKGQNIQGGEKPFPQIHCKKRLAIFPSPTGMSRTKLSLAGNNLIIPGQA